MAHITQDAQNVYLHFAIPKANNLPERVVEALANTKPMPLGDDGLPKYTNNEWAWRCFRSLLIETVQRYEAGKAVIIANETALATAGNDCATID